MLQIDSILSSTDERNIKIPIQAKSAGQDGALPKVLNKANEAIAVRPRRGRLLLLTRRLHNALLYHAQRQGPERTQFEVTLPELAATLKYDGRNIAVLKDGIRALQTTLVEWNVSGEGIGVWGSTQLLGSVELIERGRGIASILRYSFPQAIQRELLSPSRYTRLLMAFDGQMRSYAAAALFEIAKQYESSPAGLTMRQPVHWWMSVLTGRAEVENTEYKYFKRDTLARAIVEIHAYQDALSIELLEIRGNGSGSPVSELQFQIRKAQQTALHLPPTVIDDVLIAQLQRFGFTESQAQVLYGQYEETELEQAIRTTAQRLNAHPPLQNPSAYLRTVLKSPQAPAAKPADVPVPVQSATAVIMKPPTGPSRQAMAHAAYSELSQGVQDDLRKRFEDELVPTLAGPVRRAWTKDGLSSPLGAPAFYGWVAHQLRLDQRT